MRHSHCDNFLIIVSLSLWVSLSLSLPLRKLYNNSQYSKYFFETIWFIFQGSCSFVTRNRVRIKTVIALMSAVSFVREANPSGNLKGIDIKIWRYWFGFEWRKHQREAQWRIWTERWQRSAHLCDDEQPRPRQDAANFLLG